MERAMSVEEKIRRATQIYERRRQGEVRPVAKVTVNNKKDVKLLKKMLIQLLICTSIYLAVYVIQNNEYIFSKDFINKVNEILSYDTNFYEIYENAKNYIMTFLNKEQKEETNNQEAIGGAKESTIQEQNVDNVTNQGTGEENKTNENQVQEEKVLTQEEQNILNVKNTTSFIKPVEGKISSGYGRRDNATGTVPKDHTGTDIAANLGTKIKSATDGEVVLSSEEGDYRKTFKNSNRRSKHYLCTL